MPLRRVLNLKTMTNALDPNKPGLHSTLLSKAKATGKFGAAERGMCFRISYKWLIAQWEGGTFKAENTNVEKAYQKQLDYLKQADTMKGQEYSLWFKNSNVLSKTTLQAWGSKHNHSCAEPFVAPSLAAADPLKGNPDVAMIVGFFGLKYGTDVWGHATAYCCRNNTRQFFDINYGVYEFDSGDNPGQAMEDWITKKYVDPDKKIKDFVLYQIH